jgi:hypothetical protein
MATDGLILQISKLDAAHRQLQTAIRMWFYDADPVSTHALAYAAYEVVHDVSKARNPNRPDMLFDSKHIKPDKRKEFIRTFKEAANFFKHANRDPHAFVNFTPGLTQVLIFYAIYGIELSGEMLADELLIFKYYLQITTPQILSEEVRKVIADSRFVKHLKGAQAMPKHEFFEAAMYGLNKP